MLAGVVVIICSCAPMLDADRPIPGTDKPITLTEQNRSMCVPIDRKDLAARSPILDVVVSEVFNPSRVPLGVAVSIVAGDRKVPLGKFAFYPSNQEGTFHLNSKQAFAQAGSIGDARLCFELQKLRPSADWKPVRVTLSRPQWRREIE